jgi:predicted NUDIX family phosphoesterase
MTIRMEESRISYLDVAERLLREAERPMSAREIVSIAVRSGTLRSNGATPWQTMKSKLSTDILTRGNQSRFKRVAQGLFALRSFDEEEYFASRFKANKLDEDIAVIDRSKLGSLIPSAGYSQYGIDRTLISSLAKPMLRRRAEEDFSVVQLVSVFVVSHHGKLLTHMRSARLPEGRLHGEYSAMLGGHLSVDDFSQLTLDLFPDDSLSDCSYILRELSEELVLFSSPTVIPRGYIYDESREVSRQHLGLVYLVQLESERYEIGERGFLMNSRFESISEIRSRLHEFENWSVLLVDNLDRIHSS